MMSSVGSCVQWLDAERQKQKAQIERMSRENAWLRDELAVTSRRLQLSEQHCASLDEQRSHLQFLTDLKTYEPDPAEVRRYRQSSVQARAQDFIARHSRTNSAAKRCNWNIAAVSN